MDQDIPPMLSSSPPPLERGFTDLEDDEETPTGFAFGRLDFEDDTEMPAVSRSSRKPDNLPARTEESTPQSRSSANTAGSPANFQHVILTESTQCGDQDFDISEDRTSIAINRGAEQTEDLVEESANNKDRSKMRSEQLETESFPASAGDVITPVSADDVSCSELRPECSAVEASEVDSTGFVQTDPEPSQSLFHNMLEGGLTSVKDDTESDSGWIEAGDCEIPDLEAESAVCVIPSDTLPEINPPQSQTAQVNSDFAFEMIHDKPDDSSDFAVENSSVVKDDDADDDWAEFSDFSVTPADSKPEDIAEEFDDFQSVSVANDSNPNKVTEPFDAVLDNVFGAALLPDDSTAADDAPILSTIAAPSGEKIWTALEHLDETSALNFQWASSFTRQKMLQTLNLSPSSVFSMQKKEPVALHNSKANDNNGILQPVKVERNQKQQPGNEASVGDNPGDRVRNLDFASSGNPSTQPRFPDLGQPVHPEVRKADISFIGSGTPVPVRFVPGESVKSSKLTNGVVKPVPPKLLDEEVQDIVKRFRNLDFMQSTTLIKTASKPSSFQKF